jgi:hypothetical protein
VVSGETVLTEDLLCCSFVVASLTGSVLERVKKIDRKLDELRTFLEDVSGGRFLDAGGKRSPEGCR